MTTPLSATDGFVAIALAAVCWDGVMSMAGSRALGRGEQSLPPGRRGRNPAPSEPPTHGQVGERPGHRKHGQADTEWAMHQAHAASMTAFPAVGAAAQQPVQNGMGRLKLTAFSEKRQGEGRNALERNGLKSPIHARRVWVSRFP